MTGSFIKCAVFSGGAQVCEKNLNTVIEALFCLRVKNRPLFEPGSSFLEAVVAGAEILIVRFQEILHANNYLSSYAPKNGFVFAKQASDRYVTTESVPQRRRKEFQAF